MSRYSEILDGYRVEGRLRSIPAEAREGVMDLSSNDYLGLARRRDLVDEFLKEGPLPPFTSVASRLLASRQSEYDALERWLADEYGKPVLLFNSGYHANTGCVSALAVEGTAIVADKLVHASIIDGIKLGNAPLRRFRHNDLSSLRRELEKASAQAERVWLIVESVYSMDGDMAPLREIVEMKREFPKAMLYVDEAHAVGVYGERGLGVCEEAGILPQVDLFVGTFGKAWRLYGRVCRHEPGTEGVSAEQCPQFHILDGVAPGECGLHPLHARQDKGDDGGTQASGSDRAQVQGGYLRADRDGQCLLFADSPVDGREQLAGHGNV